MNFGETLKQARFAKRNTMRNLCLRANCSPSDYSKVERNLAPPPDEKTLDALRIALGYEVNDDRWRVVLRMAQQRWVPPPPLTEKELAGKLPALISLPDEDSVNALLDTVKNAHTADPNLHLVCKT